MRTIDVDRLRELPSPLSPVATPLIVKLDPVRAVRRRAFLCAAMYIRYAVYRNFVGCSVSLAVVVQRELLVRGSVGIREPLLWARSWADVIDGQTWPGQTWTRSWADFTPARAHGPDPSFWV